MLLWPPDDQLQTELVIPGAPDLPAFLTATFTSAKREEEPYLPTQESNKKKKEKKKRKQESETSTLVAKPQLPLLRPAMGLWGFWGLPVAPPFPAPLRSPFPLRSPRLAAPSAGGQSWPGREGTAPLPGGSHDMSCRSCTEAHVTELIIGFPPPPPASFFLFLTAVFLSSQQVLLGPEQWRRLLSHCC